jgi:hypothetical protein
VVRLGGATVGALPVPVRRSVAVDHVARGSGYGHVCAGYDDRVEIVVGGEAEGLR